MTTKTGSVCPAERGGRSCRPCELPLHRRCRPLRGDRRPRAVVDPRENLDQRHREEDVHHRRLWSALRRCLSRRLKPAECDHAGAPGIRPFTLRLRIPGWSEGASVSVNGENHDGKIVPGTYLELRRTWRAGDTIALEIPMPPQLIVAHPLVEEARNQVAVKRGPIVYCLESIDLPNGARLQDVHVPRDIDLKPRFAADLLSGVGVLEGQTVARAAGDWDGKLYRPLGQERRSQILVRFIPYFASFESGQVRDERLATT